MSRGNQLVRAAGLKNGWFVFTLIGLLAFCVSCTPDYARVLKPTSLPARTSTATPTQKPAMLTATPTITALPTIAPTLAAAATTLPATAIPARSTPITITNSTDYQTFTIDSMAARTYGGTLQAVQSLQTTAAFTRTLIAYQSDGLRIVGFMNVPAGTGPFPVVIALHGYVEPSEFSTLTYTTRYADALARAGFLVLHPNLRNFPPSDNGPDVFRTGLTADVLNLIAIVKAEAGKPGPLAAARSDAIGLWGHSLGGGVALRVLTISTDVKAALLYASLSGDEAANYDYVFRASKGTRGVIEHNAPQEIVRGISPIFHVDRVQAAVSVHHGANDAGIPLQTSLDLCKRLTDAGKTVECFMYANQGHVFGGQSDALFNQRAVAFFRQYLR